MNSEELDHIFLENWMCLLASELQEKRLIDLFIPGSHDANTHSIPPTDFGSAFARCQNIDVERQAALGIRFFDLRYGPGKKMDQVIDKHGPFNGGDFLANFEGLRRFSEKHPEEFFMITMQPEAEISPTLKKTLIRKISGILHGKLVVKNDLETWFRLPEVTIARILKSPRRFLLVAREDLWTGTSFTADICAKIGIHERSKLLINTFHNATEEGTLFAKNLENLRLRTTQSSLLFSSQFVLTTDLKNMRFVIKRLFTMDMPTIVNFVSKLHNCNRLPKLIFENIGKQFNLFLFDQIDFDLSLQKIIISANQAAPLHVHKVLLGNRDITAQLDDSYLNGKQLYVPSVAALSEKFLPKFDQLCVVYSYGQDDFRVQLSRPNADTFLIFNNPIREAKRLSGKSILVLRTHRKFKLRHIDGDPSDEQCDDICSQSGFLSLLKVGGKQVRHYKYSKNTR
jgi:hypothetical protein